MRYLGGKAKIARWIEGHVLSLPRTRDYVEPFVGGGNVFPVLAPHFSRSFASDVHPDLILMWQAVAAGWDPPSWIDRDEYYRLKAGPPSALRGFAGFGCSFSGVWFQGWIGEGTSESVLNGRKKRSPFCVAARDAVLRAAPAFRDAAKIVCVDYRLVRAYGRLTVYADPPYRGTNGYGGTPPFDSDEFWRVAEGWSRAGARVIVSEAEVPPGWSILACRTRKAILGGTESGEGTRKVRFEFLLTREPGS